ncbi:hypothetical protein COOONC_05000 [Cooperia oncophora]
MRDSLMCDIHPFGMFEISRTPHHTMTETSGRAFALAISILMVVTGSLNTICAKWADSLKAEGTAFNHPFLQATCMFFGEFLCLVAFFVIYGYKKHRWNAANISGESGSVTDITSDCEPQLPPVQSVCFLAAGLL